MKRYIKTPITASYKEGLIAIWWYTDGREFWDFSTTLENAEDDNGFLQYSKTENHLSLWGRALENFVDSKDLRDKLRAKGYKSIERGRVIFNIRTQCYEIICSETLASDTEFKKQCVDYFNLSGNRYDFLPLRHYSKIELTGNPAIDDMCYEW